MTRNRGGIPWLIEFLYDVVERGTFFIRQRLRFGECLNQGHRRAAEDLVHEVGQKRFADIGRVDRRLIHIGNARFVDLEESFLRQILHDGHDRGVGHRPGAEDAFVNLGNRCGFQFPDHIEDFHFGVAEREG